MKSDSVLNGKKPTYIKKLNTVHMELLTFFHLLFNVTLTLNLLSLIKRIPKDTQNIYTKSGATD